MRIVITDSGLGGLSVVAELERRLNKNPIFKTVELIFFNSLHSSDYGYNSIKDFSEKVTLFNNALNSIEVNYNPELILIACNTLSVLFPYTEFAQNSKTTVKGILDSGVTLFKNYLQNENEIIILFGTPTTISSDSYKNELVKHGVNKKQIINKACPNLETEIQNNPYSSQTRNSIIQFVKEAIDSLDFIPKKIYAGFCCTHYGYSENLFFNELLKQSKSKIEILNPNNRMIDFLFNDSSSLNNKCSITINVVSQVELKENEIKSLSEILIADSPKSASALENYHFIKILFDKN